MHVNYVSAWLWSAVLAWCHSLPCGCHLYYSTWSTRLWISEPLAVIRLVTDAHSMPTPLVYNLGETSLIITSGYGSPDAFELAAPGVIDDDTPQSQTIILDQEETYNLYQCLHTLFHPTGEETSE